MRRSWIWGAAAIGLALSACSESSPPLGVTSADAAVDARTRAGITTLAEPVTTSTATPGSLDPVATSLTTTSSTTTTSLVESLLPTAAPPPAANAVEPLVEVGVIEIPSIGVSKPTYEGVSLGVLDHGPGHWPGTAQPGQVGNMVIAGHRMSHDHPFRDIDQLVPGDEVIVGDSSGRYTYRVTSTEIVAPDALWILDPTPTATATLFACHPKGSTRQRIVVHLELETA